MEMVERYKPYMATVIDIEDDETHKKALDWAEEIATCVAKIVMIPKVDLPIPESINGKEIIIGYSVPTRYGGTKIPIEKFVHRRIHLLGGSPHAQMEIYMKYPKSIYSADGNYHQKIAIRNKVWELGTKRAYGMWTPLSDVLGHKCEIDCPYLAFEISCNNIMNNWIAISERTKS